MVLCRSEQHVMTCDSCLSVANISDLESPLEDPGDKILDPAPVEPRFDDERVGPRLSKREQVEYLEIQNLCSMLCIQSQQTYL